jgi:transcriptional regulator with XRE-family HTH domain
MNARALVAWNLRCLRVGKGLSQESLAHEASIDRSYVSRLERGLENPTVTILERLAGALGADVSEFFFPVNPEAPPPKPLPGGRKANRANR